MAPTIPNDDRAGEKPNPQHSPFRNLLLQSIPKLPNPASDPEAQARIIHLVEVTHLATQRHREARTRWMAIAAGIAVGASLLLTASQFNRTAAAQDALVAARTEVAELRAQLVELQTLIARSGLEDAVRAPDPPFAAAGRDTIAVRGSVDPRYIARVTARVGDETHVLYEQATPSGRAARVPFEDTFAVTLGTGRVDASLDIEPFPEVTQQFPSFFGSGRTHYERTFLASTYGLIADPTAEDLEGVADLETIELRADAENPSRYVVGGFLRRLGDHRYAWLVIDPVFSGQMYVGSFISVDPNDPEFRARCHLGTRVDQGEYRVFLVTSADPDALHEGQTIPRPFDWESQGFRKSSSRLAINDGRENGFAVDRQSP